MGQVKREQGDPRNLLIEIGKIFEKLKLPYLVTGGMAVLVWGRPRFTAYIDIVLEIEPNSVSDLVNALKGLHEAGYVDEDVVNEMVKSGGEFNFIDGATGIKIDFWTLKKDSFDMSRLKRRIAKDISGYKVYFTSSEDLILSKLKWYNETHSARHLQDIESVLEISKSELDLGYLNEWAEKLQVSEEFAKLLN